MQNSTALLIPVKPAHIVLPDSAFAVEPWMVEPPALDDPARRWWAEQNAEWHALDEIDPATDGILASDWAFNRHLDELAEESARMDAIELGTY